MSRLVVRSCAKINLGLRVLGRREDGYHEIRTTLQTIDLADEVRLEDAPDLSLEVEGRAGAPTNESNLAMRAALALSERCPGRGARIRLVKTIPAGAGLGGGSSNAAATLMGLDRLWGLSADPGVLYSVARTLGMDVPFFLYGGACLALGAGDEVLPLPDPPEWAVVVAWPGTPLATREVYGALPSSLTRPRILSSMKGFVPAALHGETSRSAGMEEMGSAGAEPRARPPDVVNDLEETAFLMVPALRRLKDRLLESGAAAAALSGSGSAVYGLFHPTHGLEKVAASLASGEVEAFTCRTLSRDEYRLKLFERSWT